MAVFFILANALCVHRIDNFLEACDVSACNIVSFHAVFLGCIGNVVADGNHDLLKFCVNLIEGPAQTLAVLGHLKCRCCNSTGVSCFTRCKDNTILLQILCSFESCRHVSTFTYCNTSVCNKCLCIFKVKLILCSTWKSDVNFNIPYSSSFVIL